MTANPALLPSPALFDVTTVAKQRPEGRIVRVELEQIELAPNTRKEISPEGINRLAQMLARTGQLVPCIGHRPSRTGPVILCAGQRRLLAARRSHELAGTDAFDGLEPIRSLIVLLLSHAPSRDEIRRIQAQENAREELSIVDQQAQFADCWHARAGLNDDERLAVVCADLGISARKAHNLRRQLTLPEQIRTRVADRPAGEQLSVTMANQLADMHEIAPDLTQAVAARITTSELHDSALRDLGAFVHRTIVEDEHAYAVRIDEGVLLDAHEQIQRARPHLIGRSQTQLASLLGCEPGKLETELDALAARAKTNAVKIRITTEIRERARTGRYAYVHQRGQDFADSIWVIDPVFMIDLAREQLQADSDQPPAREDAYFGTAKLNDDELRDAGAHDAQRRQAERARQLDAERSNLGLGHDIAANLIDPTAGQLHAVKAIACHLLAAHYRDLIAYGAGWTNRERQQPVGDSGRYEPLHPDTILDAELKRALEDPDPLRGIAQLLTRWAAAFVLNPDGVTRTKTLGRERIARKLQDALPGGKHPLRTAVWQLMRPILSPPWSSSTATRSSKTPRLRAPSGSSSTAATQTSTSSTSARTPQRSKRQPRLLPSHP